MASSVCVGAGEAPSTVARRMAGSTPCGRMTLSRRAGRARASLTHRRDGVVSECAAAVGGPDCPAADAGGNWPARRGRPARAASAGRHDEGLWPTTEPCDLTATQARALIGRRALSPVDLLDSCLRRVGEVNHAVNAMVAIDEPAARAAAKAAEDAVMKGGPLGLLHGLPVGIKDLEETRGLRTTYGSPIFADFVPEADCGMVTNLRCAGAVVTGKTNTPEFGAGAGQEKAPIAPSRSDTGRRRAPRIRTTVHHGGRGRILRWCCRFEH